MINAIDDSYELNLDTGFLEIATVSILREYLARKVSREKRRENLNS